MPISEQALELLCNTQVLQVNPHGARLETHRKLHLTYEGMGTERYIFHLPTIRDMDS